MEHTLGPWRQVGHTIWAGKPNSTNGPIAEASGSTAEEVEANARLIAAAPALLSALDWALSALDRGDGVLEYTGDASDGEAARAAILAAKGEAND